MKLIIDIDEDEYKFLKISPYPNNIFNVTSAIAKGTPITDNATNGDVIKVVFGDDKVFGFIHYVRLMAKVGNWFNEGVVAEFDKDWWNAPYQQNERRAEIMKCDVDAETKCKMTSNILDDKPHYFAEQEKYCQECVKADDCTEYGTINCKWRVVKNDL